MLPSPARRARGEAGRTGESERNDPCEDQLGIYIPLAARPLVKIWTVKKRKSKHRIDRSPNREGSHLVELAKDRVRGACVHFR